jgi:uncharacterized protein
MNDSDTQLARMRVYVTERKRIGSIPLADIVLRVLRESGVAGATVFHGAQGFGSGRDPHHPPFHLSPDIPVVIEVVDQARLIEQALDRLSPIMGSGFATVEPVRAIRFPRS